MNITRGAAATLLLAGGTEAFAPNKSCGAIKQSQRRTIKYSALHLSSYQNDGPFAFMQSALELGGLTSEGKSIYYGVFTKDVDPRANSPEEAEKLRQQAAESLTNIDDAERNRRDQAGDVMAVLSAIYILWASLIADDGGVGGHILRMVAAMPIFLAVGYKKSAKEGLCNIAQAGVWDVDGNGLSKIEDLGVAKAINEKVNKMNSETALFVVVPVAIFAALDVEQSRALVLIAAFCAALYFLRGKIPENIE